MVSAVIKFKVEKAIKEGCEPDAKKLAAWINRPDALSEIEELYPDMVFIARFGQPEPIPGSRSLLDYANEIVQHGGIDALVNFEHYSNACGCMGPRDGYPLCPCSMSAKLANCKKDVLNEILGKKVNPNIRIGGGGTSLNRFMFYDQYEFFKIPALYHVVVDELRRLDLQEMITQAIYVHDSDFSLPKTKKCIEIVDLVFVQENSFVLEDMAGLPERAIVIETDAKDSRTNFVNQYRAIYTYSLVVHGGEIDIGFEFRELRKERRK